MQEGWDRERRATDEVMKQINNDLTEQKGEEWPRPSCQGCTAAGRTSDCCKFGSAHTPVAWTPPIRHPQCPRRNYCCVACQLEEHPPGHHKVGCACRKDNCMTDCNEKRGLLSDALCFFNDATGNDGDPKNYLNGIMPSYWRANMRGELIPHHCARCMTHADLIRVRSEPHAREDYERAWP